MAGFVWAEGEVGAGWEFVFVDVGDAGGEFGVDFVVSAAAEFVVWF